MIVADLIRALQACDPDAIVLIPCDQALGGEPLADVVVVPPAALSRRSPATRSAVRLAGLSTAALTSVGVVAGG